jgi:putative DNA primase/helicase
MRLEPIDPQRKLTAALAYAQAGVDIFPLHTPMFGRDGVKCSCARADCINIGKHPRTKNGFKDATRDEAQIQIWYKMWPDANIGASTAGMVVVDVDPDHGGELTWKALERDYGRVETWTVLTGEHEGTRGQHLWYRAPKDTDMRNTSGKSKRISLGNGIDTRANGGYVILPPSGHESGVEYVTKSGGPEGIAPLPGWILQKLQTPAGPTDRESGAYFKSVVADVDRLLSVGGQIEAGGRDELVWAYCCGLRSKNIPLPQATQKVKAVWGALEQPDGNTFEWEVCEEKLIRAYAQFEPGKSEEFQTHSGKIIYRLTDDGNALRLVAKHGEDIRFVPGVGPLVWDGAIWREDATGRIQELAKDTARGIWEEAQDVKDDDQIKKVAMHGIKTQSARAITAMITLARTDPRVVAETEKLDSDPHRISVGNGTLDLATGVLKPHDRSDLITWRTGIDWDPDAVAPQWERFLDWAARGDLEVKEFLQRAAGYTLTGDTGEQVFFFLYGRPGTGKSTFVDVLGRILGPGHSVMNRELLLENKTGSSSHQSILAVLRGKRMATHTETEEGGSFAVSRIKGYVSGEKVQANMMRQNPFDFYPQFKLWVSGNHKPRVKAGDPALFRRLILVPFQAEKPDEAHRINNLAQKLVGEEGPGILRWAVAGAQEWSGKGLQVPASIRAEGQQYQHDEDWVTESLDSCFTLTADGKMSNEAMMQVHQDWCTGHGRHSLSVPKLTEAIKVWSADLGYAVEKPKTKMRFSNSRPKFGLKGISPIVNEQGKLDYGE